MWLRDHAKAARAGGKPTLVARGPYRVFSLDGPTVLLDVRGEHRRKNASHVVHASDAAFSGPTQQPALQVARSFHGEEADGQRYAVERIADHTTWPYGTLRVHVSWTWYLHANWMDVTDAQHEKLHAYLRRAARLGLPHASADSTRAAPCDAVPAVGAAEGVAGAPPPAIRA